MDGNTTSSKAVLRNIVHAFSAWVLPLCLSFVVTRVVVRSLGTLDYGIYALVLGFVSYSFNFSISRAITRFLAADRMASHKDKIRGIVSATILLTICVASFGSAVVVTLSSWLVRDVFSIEPFLQDKAVTAIRIGAAMVSALVIGQLGTAVFHGMQRFDVYSKIQNATSVVTMLGNLILAYLGWGLLALLYWNLAASVIFSTINLLGARAMLAEIGVLYIPSRESILTVLRYSAGVIGYQAIGNAFFLFERGWIISKLGAEELTYYAVPMTMAIFLQGFISSLNLVLFPLTSELSEDRKRLIRLYHTATRSVMLIVFIVVISLVACGRLFLSLWLGPDFGEHSAVLLSVQAVAFGLASIGVVAFQTAEGLGHPGFNFRNIAIGILAALIVAVLLTAPYGSLGVAYGRVVCFVIPMVAVIDFERRYLGGFRANFWLRNFARLFAGSVTAFLVEVSILNLVPSSWLTLIAAVAAGILTYASVLLALGYLTPEDRRLVSRILAS